MSTVGAVAHRRRVARLAARYTAAALACLCAAGTWAADETGPGATGTAVAPRQAPRCALVPIGAAPLPDWDRLRGKVVVVDFWASWCVPCARAIPFFNRLAQEFGKDGLKVLGIGVDERPDEALAFLARHPAAFDIAGDASGRCPRAFAVKAMPSSYLVDRAGFIRHVHLGFNPEDAALLRRQVQELLQERP